MRSSVFWLGGLPSSGVAWVSSVIGVAAAHAASSILPSIDISPCRIVARATGRGSFSDFVICCALSIWGSARMRPAAKAKRRAAADRAADIRKLLRVEFKSAGRLQEPANRVSTLDCMNRKMVDTGFGPFLEATAIFLVGLRSRHASSVMEL